MDQCAVCGMKIVDSSANFCNSHLEAYNKVKDAYLLWSAAYGGITIEVFLNRLLELPETGTRAREMVQFLSGNLERWK